MVSINETGLDDRVEVYSCLEIRKPHTGPRRKAADAQWEPKPIRGGNAGAQNTPVRRFDGDVGVHHPRRSYRDGRPWLFVRNRRPIWDVHSINVMIQNNGLLGGTSFDYHQDGHALDQPNPECLGYTHIAALYVDSRVCCS